MNFENILVAIDFSETSKRALEAAEDLARRCKARLHLVHSHPIQFLSSSPYAPVLPVYHFDDLDAAARKQLHTWRTEHCAEGLEVEEHLTEEPPSLAIVDTANEIGADLIVIGTRGLTGLKHVLLGSVAERVVQGAKCPVLTIK